MISHGFNPRPLREAFFQHARVVHALMLRDIKTRMGASYFGFLLGLLIPLAHIGILLVLYVTMGRRAPIGTDVTAYLTTAILPFVIWSYTHQRVMGAFNHNKPLLNFPVVKIMDILTARSLVEVLNATLIVIVVSAALMIAGSDLFIFDPQSMLYSLILAYMLGVSTGFLFGLISMMFPAAMIVAFLIIPIYWISSGVLFIPAGLPEQARNIAWIFPLAHIVDFGRTAFYPGYVSDFGDLWYVHVVIAINLAIGMAVQSFLRVALTTK